MSEEIMLPEGVDIETAKTRLTQALVRASGRPITHFCDSPENMAALKTDGIAGFRVLCKMALKQGLDVERLLLYRNGVIPETEK